MFGQHVLRLGGYGYTAQRCMMQAQTSIRSYNHTLRSSAPIASSSSVSCGVRLFASTPPSSNNSNDSHHGDNTTHFGFTTVDTDEKQSMVHEVFRNVASKYDVMNDVMSVGIHRIWKDHFVSTLGPTPNMRLLDVAGGTGDIAFRFLDHANSGKGTEVVVCDINRNMLDVGEQRAIEKGLGGDSSVIQWVEGNAERLPFEDQTFDAYTIAFGIRNVTDIPQALSEAHRVLKPGGRFLCLEFSHLNHKVLQQLYDAYSFQLIPQFGEMIAGDRGSYQYLVESIRRFPNQQTFEQMIRTAGFKGVTHENLNAGIACIHSGVKL